MRISAKHPSLFLAGGLLAAAGAGCGLINANIFDTDIHLQEQVYSHDFGTPPGGTLMRVPCTAQNDPCSMVAAQVNGEDGVQAQCDTTRQQCYAQATLNLTYPVNLGQDQSFQSNVGQKAVQFVQAIELDYGMVNSLNFALPQVDLYVGPQGTMHPSDANVAHVATIGPFSAGQMIADNMPQKIVVQNGSPAFTLIENNFKNPKSPFVFLVSATPRFDAGQSIPGGKIELHLYPIVTIGLPR